MHENAKQTCLLACNINKIHVQLMTVAFMYNLEYDSS